MFLNPRGEDEREITCDIRDEHGTIVYRAILTLKGQRSPNQ